jgi:predicted NUDIX family NTP pyrophosphohydrolase
MYYQDSVFTLVQIMKTSAGLLPYYIDKDQLQVMLVHPGGPFYVKKDDGAWSVPKGEYTDEDPLEVAKKEFSEETGNVVSNETFIPLGEVTLKSGKRIKAWAMKCSVKLPFINSNTFELEWPPRSGKMVAFPEVDKADWFDIKQAKEKIHPPQRKFLEQLKEILQQQ